MSTEKSNFEEIQLDEIPKIDPVGIKIQEDRSSLVQIFTFRSRGLSQDRSRWVFPPAGVEGKTSTPEGENLYQPRSIFLITVTIFLLAAGLTVICVMVLTEKVAVEQDTKFYDLAGVDRMNSNDTSAFRYYRSKEKVAIKSDYKEVFVFVGPTNHTSGKLDFYSKLNKEFEVGSQIKLRGRIQPRSTG